MCKVFLPWGLTVTSHNMDGCRLSVTLLESVFFFLAKLYGTPWEHLNARADTTGEQGFFFFKGPM